MSDRLDDVLRDQARVDAPPDFARRVRVQLDATSPAPRAWPRLAAVAGTLLLVAGLWMGISIVRETDDRVAGTVEDGALVGVTKVPPAQVQGTGPAVERHVTVHPEVRAGGASVRAGGAGGASVRAGGAGRASVRAGGALAPPTSDTLSVLDHDRALPALAQLGTIGPESLVSIPATIDAREVAALTAIAPIDIPALGADEGERR